MKNLIRHRHAAGVLSLGLFILSLVAAGCGKGMVSCETFREMDDPQKGHASGWEDVSPGLHVSFVPVGEKYAKSFVPEVTVTDSHGLRGWKGETVSAQLLIWTREDAPGVTVSVGRFSGSGGKLAKEAARARFVRYVMTDEFGPGCGYRKPEDFPASLAPDMLDDIECLDVEGSTVRPVWLTVDIPRTAPAGTYETRVEVSAGAGKPKVLNLALEVIDRVLPEPSQWEYHLDLWQHPSAVARVGGLEMWSDAHFEAMRPVMEMLAGAGQKVVTATLNKDPWNNQSFDAYADMILWTRKAGGGWEYDYSVFNRWVTFMREIGITGMINCYSVLPWNNELHYLDEASGEIVTVRADPGSPHFEEMWVPFLTDFVDHLRDKGWLDITNIAMDERSPEHMDITMALLREVAPELGVALQDNHRSYEKYTHVRDLCVGAYQPVGPDDIAYRSQRGLNTTYYVCCSHPFPNFFTFSRSGEAVYAAWYAVAHGYDGMLHWSYNSWVENPLTDSRFRTWPAGDTYLVYPGGRSSIRFERLREGVQDAEKIRILRKEATAGGACAAAGKLAELEAAIAGMDTLDPGPDWESELQAAKRLLNDIPVR